MIERRKNPDRRISPAIGDFALEERAGLLEQIAQRDARIEKLSLSNDELARMLAVVATKLAALKAQQQSAQEWPKQECPVTGAITDVDPADMAGQQPSGVVLSDASLTAAVDAAMVEMQNISPPLRRGECARLIRAAVARLNPCRAQAVPEGYVLVPVEPTLEMMKASKRELEKSPVIWCRYKAAYRALLAAAPSAKKESDDEN